MKRNEWRIGDVAIRVYPTGCQAILEVLENGQGVKLIRLDPETAKEIAAELHISAWIADEEEDGDEQKQ